MNDDNTVEAGNETELLCTRVTLLLKFLARNNAHNAKQKLLRDILFQIQQSDRHVLLLPLYSSKKNYSTLPIEKPDDVSQYFQSLQINSPNLNQKKHTKQQPTYVYIFL